MRFPLFTLLKFGIVCIGATRPQYAPEPMDVGKRLKVEVDLPDGSRESLTTSGPIDGGKRFSNSIWNVFLRNRMQNISVKSNVISNQFM